MWFPTVCCVSIHFASFSVMLVTIPVKWDSCCSISASLLEAGWRGLRIVGGSCSSSIFSPADELLLLEMFPSFDDILCFLLFFLLGVLVLSLPVIDSVEAALRSWNLS